MFKLHISHFMQNCCDKCEHFAVCQVGQIPRLTQTQPSYQPIIGQTSSTP